LPQRRTTSKDYSFDAHTIDSLVGAASDEAEPPWDPHEEEARADDLY